MLKKEQVEHIAELAKLKFSPEEIESFRQELSLILDYIETLKKADVSGQEIGLAGMVGELPDIEKETDKRREDKAKLGNCQEKLLKLMPAREGDYLKTKPIIKK